MSDTENNIVRLLRALVAPMQEIENAAQQLLIMRSVDDAVGYQLDVLGKIVGEPRGGNDDDTYRRYIRARIAVHNSNGTIEDAIKVSDLIIYDDDAYYHVLEYGIASFIVRVEGVVVDTLATPLIRFLRPTAGGGIRVVLETWPEVESDMFVCGDVNGATVTGKGCGDVNDAAAGGHLANAME